MLYISIHVLLICLFRKDDDENFEETHMYWVRNEDENETCLCEVNLSWVDFFYFKFINEEAATRGVL